MINNKTCEITFELDFPIIITVMGSGTQEEASSITFKKPNRQTGPIFQNLAAMFNRAMQKQMMEMKALASEEDIEEAQQINKAKQDKVEDEPVLKSILDVTLEEVMEEVESMTGMVTGTDFDFAKGFKLFEKMLLSSDKRNVICELGGRKLTDGMLDQIHYQDHLKMMLVYICFFGKPVKSGTTKDSDKQPESPTPATEV